MPDALISSRTTLSLAALGRVLAVAATLAASGLGGEAWARGAPETFADLVDKVLPSVVNIATTQGGPRPGQAQAPTPRGPGGQAQPQTPLDELFRNFEERNRQAKPQQRRTTALGSGFIIDASGYIVTNNHVIEGATEITVILQDEERFPATLIGVDKKTDLALLKVQANRPLPALTWGDSDAARVGDWVMAIGNPFGLGGTVTVGIISARARDISQGPYDNFIQTDASINRGNSGGPLFNLDGQVIGINTAIYSPNGNSVGIGFAVPAAISKHVIAQLQKYGRTKRGWIGVNVQTVPEDLAKTAGLERTQGALIASVKEGGPAEKGKIQAGDVVLSFDDRPIPSMRELPRIVADTDPGRDVPVEVWRGGHITKLLVNVGELEEAEQQQAAANPTTIPDDAGAGTMRDLGLGLAVVTDELRKKFQINPDVKGVVVTEVTQGGAAADRSLAPGDVIVEVAQQEVTTPASVQAKIKAAKDAGRRSVLMLVNRRGENRFVAMPVGG
ncbi:MAG: DegQ family serine endoprotease [Alphaproteobacteria bacterium]|nr:DegQ family serine endoprotease [Alphaproteobacteria bacterium]